MTMGPAPMMRMLLMFVRFGILWGRGKREGGGSGSTGFTLLPSPFSLLQNPSLFPLFHQSNKFIEQVIHIVRSRAAFRVTLEAERGLVGQLEALQGPVEQRDMRDARIRRQRRRK